MASTNIMIKQKVKSYFRNNPLSNYYFFKENNNYYQATLSGKKIRIQKGGAKILVHSQNLKNINIPENVNDRELLKINKDIICLQNVESDIDLDPKYQCYYDQDSNLSICWNKKFKVLKKEKDENMIKVSFKNIRVINFYLEENELDNKNLIKLNKKLNQEIKNNPIILICGSFGFTSYNYFSNRSKDRQINFSEGLFKNKIKYKLPDNLSIDLHKKSFKTLLNFNVQYLNT